MSECSYCNMKIRVRTTYTYDPNEDKNYHKRCYYSFQSEEYIKKREQSAAKEAVERLIGRLEKLLFLPKLREYKKDGKIILGRVVDEADIRALINELQQDKLKGEK